MIIGPQPPVANVSGQDAKNWFIFVFIKFIRAICLNNHPITLILDDLEWANSETLNLFSVMNNNASLKNLLIVGIYLSKETFL